MSMLDLLNQLSQISATLYQQTSPPVDGTSRLGFDILDFLLPFPELALDVPSPDSLSDALVRAGAPPSFARELSTIHARRAAELAERHAQTYRNSCVEIANRKSEAEDADRMKMYLRLQRADRKHYYQTLKSWEKDALDAVQTRFKTDQGKHPIASRSAFNSDFTHVLEAVFNENPFPSPAARKALADKSGMSASQIRIWFQNHRSRARKGGVHIPKPNCERRMTRAAIRIDDGSRSLSSPLLRRASDDMSTCERSRSRSHGAYALKLSSEPPTVHPSATTSADFLSSLCFPVAGASASTRSQSLISPIQPLANDVILPSPNLCQHSDPNLTRAVSDCETVIGFDSDSEGEDNHKILSSRSSSVTLVDEAVYSLSCQAPYYSFPTRYPPDIDKDPFPCRAHGDFSFPKPMWSRVPSTTTAPLSTIDVPALTDVFSRLKLDSEVLSETFPEVMDCRSLKTTSTSAIRTIYPIITHTYSAPLPFLACRIYRPPTTWPIGADSMINSVTQAFSYSACASEKRKSFLPNLQAPEMSCPKVLAGGSPPRNETAGSNPDGSPTNSCHGSENGANAPSTESSVIQSPTEGSPLATSLLYNDESAFQISHPDSLFSWGFEELFSTFPDSKVTLPLFAV